MIRQLDFLTGFARRATEPPKRGRATAPRDTDKLGALTRQGRVRDSLSREPLLAELLEEPIVRRLMTSDDVDSNDVMRVMGKEPDQDD